ncbi:MAG: DNA mismatch repair endonuclease MutL [Oscillospiraceae bacterium]|nr:DNA mismatch repair endonuclease MutL [Oscillospiraceae bacterium]
MPRIYELPGHIADLIAAGEVVERPASVVKELIENSIDAGATVITVEISSGGMTYMRVTDNGCGIAPEDAKLAFLRHATSKLKDAEGLSAINTLGFRGEALAAIAAVSRIEFYSRVAGEKMGVNLSLEAGEIAEESAAGCPEGTTIIVRDLFFNTPARLKFMKSDRAESAAVSNAVLRCALGSPEVSVRFIRDGKTEFHTPGDYRIDSCVYSLFGAEFAEGLAQAESENESVLVQGFVSNPLNARGNRSFQFFFVNGRSIRSKTLQAALEQAYQNVLPQGKYPACVLYITTNPADVDVNVHPSKLEIKFVSDKQVFDGVYYAAKGAVDPTPMRLGDNDAPQINTLTTPSVNDVPIQTRLPISTGGGFKAMPTDEFKKSYKFSEFKSEPPSAHERGAYAPVHDEKPGMYETKFTQKQDITEPAAFRVIGEAMGTYVLVELPDSILLIDKHAAHERIHFNALKSGEFEPMSQSLITPVICRHGFEDAAVLLENAELLDKFGFLVEQLGDGTVAARRIPAEIDIDEAESALSEISAELLRGQSSTPAKYDNILRTVACKAAIKAGKSSEPRELEVLCKRVVSGEIRFCPHGRPVSFEITKASLDRSFKRS